MAPKKFSMTDMVLMEMQKMGNDTFLMGFSHPGGTKEEVINYAIKTLKGYLEEHKDDVEDAPYGYSINIEFFKKGEPKNIFE